MKFVFVSFTTICPVAVDVVPDANPWLPVPGGTVIAVITPVDVVIPEVILNAVEPVESTIVIDGVW